MTVQRLAATLLVSALVSGCTRLQPPDVAPDLQASMKLREALGGTAAAATEAVSADPDGWTTLTGRIVLDAKVEPGPSFAADKDASVCAAGGHKIPDQTVELGADNALKNALIYLSTKAADTDPKWVHESYAEAAKAKTDFDQKNCIFLSRVFAMRASQTLKILNSDSVGHNTNIPELNFNQIIVANGSSEFVPNRATNDPAPVSCSIHPWMSAYVFTRKHPYFAVTDDTGKFEIKNLPAGVELEFRLWHEKVKYLPGGQVGGEQQKWPKGRMKLKLVKDEPKQLDIQLDSSMFK